MIISGFSYGLESSVWSVVAIAVTLLVALSVFPGNAAACRLWHCASPGWDC